MIYLGIHNSYQAGAALIVNGDIKGAVSEERFTRIKDHAVFPIKAISYLLKSENLNLKKVDKIVYGMVTNILPEQPVFEKLIYRLVSGVSCQPKLKKKFYERITSEIKWNKKHLEELKNWSLKEKVSHKISYVDHHLSHAAGAYFTSPFKDSLVFTCDGKGNYKSSAIFMAKGNNIRELDFQTTFDSVGYFYGIITKALGFKSERHEGKVTGLAAFGNYKKFLHITDSILFFRDGKVQTNIGDFYLPWFVGEEELPIFYEELKKHKIEDIAAAAQRTLEKVICSWVNYSIKKFNFNLPTNVCLSGGVFANVKLNQKIRELKNVKNVFVQPAMGDMGIPLGSILAKSISDRQRSKKYEQSMSLGPNITINNNIIKNIEKKFGIKIKKIKNFTREVIDLIENNKVIGYVIGKSEFGPRALCNRSIIYHCRDKHINKWLNDRLNRTEFMPFAPVTTEELAPKCFVGWNKADKAGDFMTMTYKATKKFINLCPAAVHIDNTARPQIIRKKTNQRMHSLITSFYKKTGGLALINTSLNNHEEPIVCSLEDSIKTLKNNNVDILVLENYFITKR